MAKKLNVLLVEDSEDDAELLYLELRRGGLSADMTRVETAEDFTAELNAGGWDLVLSDYNLPNFNAPAALEIVNHYESDLPFIILSGAVAAKDVVTLLKAGAHDFLEKNDLARLVPAIERELREVKMRKESKQAESTLKKLFRAVQQSPVSVMITDDKGRVEYVNPTYEAVTGYTRNEVLGNLPDVMAGDFVSLDQNAEVWDAVKNGKEWRGEFCNNRKNGEVFWEYVTVAPIRDEAGELTNLLISKEDITYRKETEEKLYRQANFDDLTGLPNRDLTLDRLGQALERSDHAALIIVDLDNFKKVNDSLGHAVGDEILKRAANRVMNCLGQGQTVGRVSGDEFAVVVPEMAGVNEAEVLISRILDIFSAPFAVGDHELFTTVSAGVAIYPDDGTDPAILFRNSEAAMSKAKEEGRNGFHFFTSHMNERAEERLLLESGLRRAIENDELCLFFQPIVDAKSGKFAGAETLIRWAHPNKGMIFPDQFISLAEETGLIVKIGKWVIDKACQCIRDFRNLGFEDFYVTVNVSPQQVWSGTLVGEVRDALEANNLDPSSLVVEMTESVCLHDTDQTLTCLNELADLGVRIAVDDFGTGYSSLSYLKRYPFHTLKIDRAFVRDIPEDSDDMALVNAMIAMAHSLGLKVVAEGVETAAHLKFLKERECDLIQGYYYSRPVAKADFIKLKLDIS
ncbi:EAL domain-containing protein [Terasakiella sp. A23]|uniref:putative bifunctional diguanylate cyclase/phosphodiesterase n=1 Tax=Terasakiella sp. FCG-A23 TaxID=3080561 RepID=UPI00295346F5|nr:EAL domain-containing protein [Terasakiella sp. A23]MDV7339396.1 EAL domain-containing protein [Terasakiella sp. A23]